MNTEGFIYLIGIDKKFAVLQVYLSLLKKVSYFCEFYMSTHTRCVGDRIAGGGRLWAGL